jgi:putative Holliday junction resolvase
MDQQSSYLSLDVGKSRIGIAIADSIAKLPSPLKTIDFNGHSIEAINSIIKEHNVAKLIVGLPRGLNGQETEQTTWLRQFYEKLKSSVKIETHLQDEALSSVRAKDELDKRGNAYTKEDIDSLAATYILEDFLNNN